MKLSIFRYLVILIINIFCAYAEDTIIKNLRYFPDEDGILIVNGEKRFNRALYGGNTAFRIEVGDLPEFALYLPGMGGNIKLGIIKNNDSKWLTSANFVKTKFLPGSVEYVIKDAILGSNDGYIKINVLALYEIEGAIIKILAKDISDDINLVILYGGLSEKKFSRNGDIGADPESSFYLLPEYCRKNSFLFENNKIKVQHDGKQLITITTPDKSLIKINSANNQSNPLELLNSNADSVPVVSITYKIANYEEIYFLFSKEGISEMSLEDLYLRNDSMRKELANRVKINVPDKFISSIGGFLSIAADAIWEDPCYLHGAVAWRIPLPGWRGAYAGDFLGWHDRARKHFESYALSQYTEPDSGPSVPDPSTNFARQLEKVGVSLYTSGYISRNPGQISKPHHYDMNLIFIDQLLWHFMWTGDTAFIKKMWPVIKRHLQWEKRCFDANDDALYDAYACIWASDALQYSGGGVTHSTAYNYRANNVASKLALIVGDNQEPFKKEAEKILDAVNNVLWLKDEGHYAEYVDLLGEKRVHKSAALWTIYHSNESGIADEFKKYLNTRYVDNKIPHIPFKVREIPYESFYLLSTTNWMPYTWSINNVAMAENIHTALAYWQAGRNNEAFRLFKSAILESMFLSSSPGNFQQLSSFDAFRGELYRDFADAIGITARTLVEGLFGIKPDALNDTLYLKPGLPDRWQFAQLSLPDIDFKYSKKKDDEIEIIIKQNFKNKLNLSLSLSFDRTDVKEILINGEKIEYEIKSGIEKPYIQINHEYCPEYIISIKLGEFKLPEIPSYAKLSYLDTFKLTNIDANLLNVYDPQDIFTSYIIFNNQLYGKIKKDEINATIFLLLEKNKVKWWHPIKILVKKPIELIEYKRDKKYYILKLKNNSKQNLRISLKIFNFNYNAFIKANDTIFVKVPDEFLFPGKNLIYIEYNSYVQKEYITDWTKKISKNFKIETIKLDDYHNDFITNIFKNKYLSPRCPYPTLQIPVHGFGDWCTYNVIPTINDSGLRNIALKNKNRVKFISNILFEIVGDKSKKNIIFTSKWDNYPDSIIIPLKGRALHVYLLMAGTTHHMQSRFENGVIRINYVDNSKEEFLLINPDTWWPIEQDYYIDNYAFKIDYPRPIRVYLKTGISTLETYQVKAKNRTNFIDGGAATILNIPLNYDKELKSVIIKPIANDVIIGLMGLSLVK